MGQWWGRVTLHSCSQGESTCAQVLGLCQLSSLFLTQAFGPFLSRIEKGDGLEEEDLHLDCHHGRHPARKWPHQREFALQIWGPSAKRGPQR